MIHCHHLHDLAEAVNSHILFQFLTVLGRIMYTAGLPSLTLKQCIFFLENCTTFFWFFKPLMVLGPIGLLFRIGVM